MKKHYLILLAFFAASQLLGQTKPQRQKPTGQAPINVADLAPLNPILPSVPAAAPSLFDQPLKGFKGLPPLPHPVGGQPSLLVYLSKENGTPYQIKGELAADPAKSLDAQVRDYLTANKSVLKLNDPAEEFRIGRMETDELGYRHTRLHQQWMGVPVHGAEAILHEKNGQFYLFNGRFRPSPGLSDVLPAIQPQAAEQIAMGHVGGLETVKPLTPDELHLVATAAQAVSELVIFYPKENEPRLAWQVTVVPNIAARYSYFIDAKTGEVLNHHTELCKIAGHKHISDCGLQISETPTSFDKDLELANTPVPQSEIVNPKSEMFLDPDGPATANANDLFGTSRLINTYQVGNSFFLIDASQTMLNNGQSVFPNEPVGVIWTIDAQNTSPENDAFGAVHITSSNNAWNNPKAVSAHFHAEKAYDYFKGTFNRNSINGQGGNIVSLINVAESDGADMDNAFWNGAAMFYGNGDQAFTAPLQKALDVAGHEMSHGVVQETANLEYLNESGALNESFADIFGAMMDRDDWQMGEDMTNPQFFPTGALRDLSDPHNGGNSLNDNGWQPAHYSERYTGSEDEGGVHINSGIVNKAFFLFASNGSVGKAKAEQVYYRALTQYLTKSSNFVDCRVAVVQAATDLHGANSAETNAAKAAFDAVGIGSNGGSDNQTDIGSNPGEDYVVMTDSDYDQLYIVGGDGQVIFDPLTSVSPLSRPSVTDNGSVVVFVDTDNKMRAITINWSAGTSSIQVLQPDAIWTNVAISKDGSRLAALTTDNDDKILVYDFGLMEWKTFQLYNPTTAQGGQNSYNVVYPDVLEWDITGQWVMYDALSRINTSGNDIEYWDIGFMYAWDGSGFGDGFIQKLYSNLPEGHSVGNPTFSKNSDYIIAFDYFNEVDNEYQLLGANIEEGETGIIFEGSELHWPNYSPDDAQMVFNANANDGSEVLAFIPLESDKINAAGGATVFVQEVRQGVWFADGERALAANDLIAEHNIRLYPNPVGGGRLNLDFSSKTVSDVQVQVFDGMGRLVLVESISATPGENHHRMATAGLPNGHYFVRMGMAEGQVAMRFVKR